jgi:hypothetical protein
MGLTSRNSLKHKILKHGNSFKSVTLNANLLSPTSKQQRSYLMPSSELSGPTQM